MGYVPVGPFTSGGAPGISAGFLNGVENFLQQINGIATDATVTSDGAGTETVTGINANKVQLVGTGAIVGFLAGSISRVSFFSGTGNATVNHGLGATPTFCMIMYAGSGSPFGSLPTHPIYYYNAGTTQVTVVADSGYSWLAMAVHS